jgi:hypothetical protein
MARAVVMAAIALVQYLAARYALMVLALSGSGVA